MQLKTGILNFRQHLTAEEKSPATIEKYLRDVRFFCKFLEHRKLCKAETIAYKEFLLPRYAPASVNSMLAALNYFLRFIRREDCCVRLLKIQRQIFASEKTKREKPTAGLSLFTVRRSISGDGIM